jgi:hypothetical protein
MFDEYLLNKIHQYIWFDKVKQLNNEYVSDHYVTHNFWNYRGYYGEYEDFIWNYKRCGYEPIIPYVNLPSKYFYSSGSNSPSGFSKNLS